MHGLVSLLDKKHTRKTEFLWEMLQEKCGYGGIESAPYPHFSWLIAQDFDWSTLEESMKEIAAETRPFTVRTNGLGIFSGFYPVIYIPLVRTKAMSALHQKIWERTQEIGTNIVSYYTPQNWVPHITLAYEGITQENISCAMQELIFHNFKWEFEVNNIGFIHQNDKTTEEILSEFKFKRET